MDDRQPVIEMANYKAGYKGMNILTELNFRACSGEVIAVLGENGAGKTTFFRSIMQLCPINLEASASWEEMSAHRPIKGGPVPASGMYHKRKASPKVVASTSLMAYLAKAAGAKDVTFIAPAELKHPPEYDFRPSDVSKVKDGVLVFAGYEPFMTKLIDSAQVSQDRLIKVEVESTPDSIKKAVRGLAEKWGTQAAEKAWEAEFDQTVAAIDAAAKKQNTSGKKVVCQTFVAGMPTRWCKHHLNVNPDARRYASGLLFL